MIKNIFPLKIYIEDTDQTGVVYHANYLNYFERARSEWAEQLGFGAHWQREQKIFFTIRQAQLEYLRPARFGNTVEVITSVNSFKKASFTYDQYLRLAGSDDNILCKAQIKVACVTHAFKARGLPELMQDILGRLKNGE